MVDSDEDVLIQLPGELYLLSLYYSCQFSPQSMAEEYHRFSDPLLFWIKWSDVNGNHLSTTAILHGLKLERKTMRMAELEDSGSYTYKKNGKVVTMSSPIAIVRRHRQETS